MNKKTIQIMGISNDAYIANRKKYFGVVAWEQFLGFRADEYLKQFKRVKASQTLENEIVFDNQTRGDFESTMNVMVTLTHMHTHAGDSSQSIFIFLRTLEKQPSMLDDLLFDVKNLTIKQVIMDNTNRFTPAVWIEELIELETSILQDANVEDIYHE